MVGCGGIRLSCVRGCTLDARNHWHKVGKARPLRMLPRCHMSCTCRFRTLERCHPDDMP